MTHVAGRIYKRPTQDGGARYYYRRKFFDNDGKRWDFRQGVGTSLERAMLAAKGLDEKTDAMIRGEAPRERVSLGDAVERYLHVIRDERKLAGWMTVRANLRAVLAILGDVSLDRVRRGDVEKVQARRQQEGKRPATVNTTARDLKRLLAFAVTEGLADQNAALGVRRLHAVPRPAKLPTVPELERFMEACPERLKRIVLTLAMTGGRSGEVLRLDWPSVDFVTDTVTLNRTKVNDTLTLRMGERLKRELWGHAMAEGFPAEGLVFTCQRTGGPVKVQQLTRAFRTVTKRLGWEWLTPKTLRKWASDTIAGEGDGQAAAQTLGHSEDISGRHYVQERARAKARARGVACLERALAGPGGTLGGTATPVSPEPASKS